MTTHPAQAFTPKNLRLTRRWRSQGHLVPRQGTYPKSIEEWDVFLQTIANDIAGENFSFAGLHSARIKGKPTLTTRTLEDVLVLRKLNDNLRRAYGIRQPNRQSLVRTAKQAVAENTPKSIIRIDIRKCFESISRDWLLSKLESDSVVSHESITLIRQLFEHTKTLKPKLEPKGLPRGVIISTSLAELKLRKVDERIRRIDGVYLVLRYVDDILVFSTKKASETNARVEEAVRMEGLEPSTTKHDKVDVACTCMLGCLHGTNCPCKKYCKCANDHPGAWQAFEYLGYKFILLKHNNSEKQNAVYCVLSDRKISRIKSRIHLAIKAYSSDPDLDLLRMRINYLTSNQAIYASPGKRSLFNGLSHTHSEYDEPTALRLFERNWIVSLDNFFQANLRKRTPPYAQIQLKGISFQSGFKDMRRTKYPAKTLNKIKECWENA